LVSSWKAARCDWRCTAVFARLNRKWPSTISSPLSAFGSVVTRVSLAVRGAVRFACDPPCYSLIIAVLMQKHVFLRP